MDINWGLAAKQPALNKRARIVQAIRAFFIGDDFLEVETPHRIPVNAPEVHIDAMTSGGWALQTSPELCMKRLLAAGYPRLFQLCRVWRDGERGSRHLPEFTLLEWYRAAADYTELMADCEALFATLAPDGITLPDGRHLDLQRPWERLTVADAFRRYAGIDVNTALAADRFDEVLTEAIEPHLGLERPTLLCDYPLALGALARSKPDNPTVAERFELYMGGIELANGFSELTDPQEQHARFLRDETVRRAAGKTPLPLPEPFLAELAAMPPAAGIALGVDRLVMLLTGAERIDQVVAFTPELL